ncbi:MAG: hypothetical protein ABSH20_00870 [Tepidisphaeraceae bacterium]|jgi:hypothetical protein
MIRNDEQLKVVRGQLELIEGALESLKRDVLPRNRANFDVMAEGYIDQIAELRSEIEQYVGVSMSWEAEGVIREVDLDENAFRLRERPDHAPEIQCQYDERMAGEVMGALGTRVVVRGTLKTAARGRRLTMEVKNIQPVDRTSLQRAS